MDSPVNTVLGNSLGPVRSRVRQLVRDFPILDRAVEIGTTCIVGDGIRFQSRVKDPSGKLDKKRIQLIEDEFSFWMDEADIAGSCTITRSWRSPSARTWRRASF